MNMYHSRNNSTVLTQSYITARACFWVPSFSPPIARVHSCNAFLGIHYMYTYIIQVSTAGQNISSIFAAFNIHVRSDDKDDVLSSRSSNCQGALYPTFYVDLLEDSRITERRELYPPLHRIMVYSCRMTMIFREKMDANDVNFGWPKSSSRY